MNELTYNHQSNAHPSKLPCLQATAEDDNGEGQYSIDEPICSHLSNAHVSKLPCLQATAEEEEVELPGPPGPPKLPQTMQQQPPQQLPGPPPHITAPQHFPPARHAIFQGSLMRTTVMWRVSDLRHSPHVQSDLVKQTLAISPRGQSGMFAGHIWTHPIASTLPVFSS